MLSAPIDNMIPWRAAGTARRTFRRIPDAGVLGVSAPQRVNDSLRLCYGASAVASRDSIRTSCCGSEMPRELDSGDRDDLPSERLSSYGISMPRRSPSSRAQFGASNATNRSLMASASSLGRCTDSGRKAKILAAYPGSAHRDASQRLRALWAVACRDARRHGYAAIATARIAGRSEHTRTKERAPSRLTSSSPAVVPATTRCP
jgi:hypothetical protein